MPRMQYYSIYGFAEKLVCVDEEVGDNVDESKDEEDVEDEVSVYVSSNTKLHDNVYLSALSVTRYYRDFYCEIC